MGLTQYKKTVQHKHFSLEPDDVKRSEGLAALKIRDKIRKMAGINWIAKVLGRET